MTSEETIRCRKVWRIIRYHAPNKHLPPEKFAHYVLPLFYVCRDKKELLSDFPPMCQNKLHEQGIQDAVNTININ